MYHDGAARLAGCTFTAGYAVGAWRPVAGWHGGDERVPRQPQARMRGPPPRTVIPALLPSAFALATEWRCCNVHTIVPLTDSSAAAYTILELPPPPFCVRLLTVLSD